MLPALARRFQVQPPVPHLMNKALKSQVSWSGCGAAQLSPCARPHSSQLPPVPLNPSSVQRATPLPARPLTSKVTCIWGRTTFWEGTWRLADK